jgi:hypothetical protein
MSDFIISPPETTDWRLNPDELADLIVSRWPDAEVGRREHPAPHEALSFRLAAADGEIEGWLADSGRSLHLDAPTVEDVAPFVLWLRKQVPRDQPLLLYDQGFNSQVTLAGDEALTESDLVARLESSAG